MTRIDAFLFFILPKFKFQMGGFEHASRSSERRCDGYRCSGSRVPRKDLSDQN